MRNEKTVRLAIPQDLNEIIVLVESVANLHTKNRPDIFRKGRHHDDDEIMEYIEGENAFVSINDADEITGVLLCYLSETNDSDIFFDSKTLFIEVSCVGEAYRRSGYGKMLFDRAREHAKEQECTDITLCVYAFNEAAQDFYKSMGMSVSSFNMQLSLTP